MNDNPFLYDLDVMIIKLIDENKSKSLNEVETYFSGSNSISEIRTLLDEASIDNNIDYSTCIAELERRARDLVLN